MISNLINRKIITLLKVQYSNMLEYRVEIALWAISGIIPEIAHNAISTLYSNMFEYWTFNKVNIFRLIKLDFIFFFN